MPVPRSDVPGSDREIVLTRVVDAPRELVWRAFTDPEHLAQWWGPQGFHTTTHRMELKPGGTWRFVMHGPDGRDYENVVRWVEVREPELLRYHHGGDVDCEPVRFDVEVTFVAEPGGRTRVTMHSTFPSAAMREHVIRGYGAIEVGKQTLARLGEHAAALAKAANGANASAPRPFVLQRVLRAPREQVFAAWTRRGDLAAWFGPPGCTLDVLALDVRPGGEFRFRMRMPDGSEMLAVWAYRDVAAPERLVADVSFTDAAGAVVRAPFDARWPLVMRTTVTFAPHAGIGRGTVVTVETIALDDDATARATFAAGHDSMQLGWTGTLDALAKRLAPTPGDQA